MLEGMHDPSLDVQASVDWLRKQSWDSGRDVREVFDEGRNRQMP